MLKSFDFDKFKYLFEDKNKSALMDEFGMIQRRIKELGIPVLIIIDGWESAGKGYVINDLVREVNHKFTKVHLFDEMNDVEKSKPYLWRFWMATPAKGDIAVFDRSFYYDVMDDFEMDEKRMKKYIKDIEVIERELTDSGTVIIKYFLNITQKTQKKRTEEYQVDKFKKVLVSERDKNQVMLHDRYSEHFDKVLELTNFKESPWTIIPSESMKKASMEILGRTMDVLKQKMLEHMDKAMFYKPKEIILPKKSKPLDAVDYKKKMSKEDYEKKKSKLEPMLNSLGYELHYKKIPTVIVFEGVDAAGKGGAIKRLTKGFDPRGYDVIPISAPTAFENSYHYMWRFWRCVPEKGRMAIFDRSWYGRVLVERVEGFATEQEWKRAYDEIKETERIFYESGIFLLKFFLTIDKEEQLKRFHTRMLDIEKNYKLTDEDWRNREKWDKYTDAYNDMIAWTDTEYAPWVLVPGDDKLYARIQVIEQVIEKGRAFIEKHDKQGK